MLNTLYYLIGFLVYTLFCVITFKIYSKTKDEMQKRLGLLIIFFCYSVLTMYVISFTDRGAPNIEIIFQSLIYIVTEAFFLWFYYKDILIKEQEYKY